jgi:mono/diheme cytochrome c family protein
MGLRKAAPLLFLASLVVFPPAAAAQSRPSTPAATPGKPQTDSQKRGEALFTKNCHLCHIYSGQKEEFKILASNQLIGLFKDSSITEQAVRQLILQGIPRSKPSFKYTLGPSEMDDLIAYLKIR